MNGDIDSLYMALGLTPGASLSEVKSAYRRLAKIYHPDHDQSLDAEVRYKEIRTAYDTLRGWYSAGGTYTGAVNYGSPERTVWTSPDWTAGRAEYDSGAEPSGDDEDGEDDEENPAERIPFSLPNLPMIFLASLIELAKPGVVVQALLAMFLISFAYAPPANEFLSERPHKKLVWIIASVSALAAVVLRYYIKPQRKPFICALAAGSYAAAAALFVKLLHPKSADILLIWLCFFVASMILALNPLLDLVNDSIKEKHGGW